MPLFNDITITSNGPRALPTVDFNTPFDGTFFIEGAPFDTTFNYTGINADITVDTITFGSIVSYGDSFNAVSIDTGLGVYGAGYSITLLGKNTQIIANAGEIEVDVTFGGGQGLIANTGVMGGTIRMGNGADVFINHIIEDQFGAVTGPVRMGSGDDVVQNASSMGRVFLGNGNDSYSVINPLDDPSEMFDAPDASAIVVRGGRGNDTIMGGDADDLFYGDANHDLIRGHGGNDKLVGGQGRDTLQGGNGDDRLLGNQSTDWLAGGKGDDTLSGGTGSDYLTGGRGDDRLIGGSGSDNFIFRGDSGSDTIAGFDTNQEKFVLQRIWLETEDVPFVYDIYDNENVDVFKFITYSDGNATLDLSGFYKSVNNLYDLEIFSNADGIEVQFLDVKEDSLTERNFGRWVDTKFVTVDSFEPNPLDGL